MVDLGGSGAGWLDHDCRTGEANTPLSPLDAPHSRIRILHSDLTIDPLATGVGLPGGMNGRQVADAARTARPDLKVLFITGYAENAVLSHGHLDAGMHVVTKTFAIDTLAARIRKPNEGERAA